MATTQVHHFRAMGTDVEVIVVDGPDDAGLEAQACVDALEAKWSRFLPASELSRLNAAAGAPVVVSQLTFDRGTGGLGMAGHPGAFRPDRADRARKRRLRPDVRGGRP